MGAGLFLQRAAERGFVCPLTADIDGRSPLKIRQLMKKTAIHGARRFE